MSTNTAITEPLQRAAAELLNEGKVTVVIGYGQNGESEFSPPMFARTAEEAERLVFDDRCFGNLSVYLSKEPVRRMGKIGIVVKGCDLRAVNVLLREHVVKREDIVLIGVPCAGQGDPLLGKCSVCEQRNPEGCDTVVGDQVQQPQIDAGQRYGQAADIDAKSIEERWEYWSGQLSKCIRCYACRNVCPLCYCKRCITEKTIPQWIETSAHLRGNIAWNVARAFHLTGRCVNCGECERACPMDIPLGAINQKMAQLMDEWYDFQSGLSSEDKAPFTTFNVDDPETGIL
ncbi:MAG: 4Fe-4S dicluster domain-containing protein [Planctomycetota bacterium]|jgi:ferredoxin